MSLSGNTKPGFAWVVAIFCIVAVGWRQAEALGLAPIDTVVGGTRNNVFSIIDPRTNPPLLITVGQNLGNNNMAVQQWNTLTNTLNSTITIPTTAFPVRRGLHLDDKRLWDNTTRRAIVCIASATTMIFDINLDARTVLNVYNSPNPGAALDSCAIDFARKTAWLGFNRRIKRVNMPALGGSGWAEPAATATSNQNPTTSVFAFFDPVDGFVYYGSLARFFRVNSNFTGALNVNGPITTILNVGAGNLLNLVIDRTNGFQYIGSDVGIGFRFPVGVFTGPSIFFVGQQNLEGIIVDTPTGSTFWSSSAGNIFRVDTSNFNTISDTITLPVALTNGVVLDNRQTAIFTARSNVANVTRVRLFDCSRSTTCGSCVNDNFCGYCIENNQCVQKEFCNATLAATANICPAVNSLSPNTGSSLGGTVVTISGLSFVNHPSTGCRFGSTFVVATFINSQTLRCVSPPGTGSLSVEISYLGSIVTFSGQTFSYYDCVGTSCTGCIDPLKPDCGFCVSTQTCTINSSCPVLTSNFQQQSTSCPSLVSVVPAESIDSGGSVVTIIGTVFFSGVPYQCKFGTKVVDAIFVNSTALTCVVPSAVSPGTSAVALDILYKSSSSVYAQNSLNFQYFNCDLASNCESCVVGKCTWCPETTSCSAIGSGTCPNTISLIPNCPILISANPASVFLGASTNVIVSGNFFTPVNADQYKCEFSATGNPNVIFSNTTAQFSSSNALLCPSPAFTTSGVSVLKILYKDKEYTSNQLDVLAYDCSANVCGGCVSPLTPLCKWCDLDNTCASSSSSCSSTSSVTTCPSLVSISTTKSHVSGQIPVDFVFSTPIPASGFTCKFGNAIVNATKIGSSSLRCVTVPSTSGIVDLLVLFKGVAYVPDVIKFQFFECGDLFADCTSCLSTPLCSYCLPFTCQDAAVSSCVTTTTNTCPSMTSLSPNIAEVLKPIFVQVFGNGLFSSSDSYECFLGGVSVGQATFLSSSVLQCSFTPTKTGIFDFVISLSGNNFVSNVLDFEVYDCTLPANQNNCSNCFNNPSNLCGWCIVDNKCSISSECSDVVTWTGDCPVITKIDPEYADIAGNTTVTVSSNFFPPNLDLKCRFDTTEVDATFISTSQITCQSPPVTLTSRKRTPKASTAFGIYFNNQIVSAAQVPFDFLDCRVDVPTGACSSCFALQQDPRCNFCVFEGTCSPSQKCDSQWIIASNSAQCPSITNIDPVTGPQEGGTTITITGASFLDTPLLLCKFGDKTTQAAFVSPSEVRCTTPPGAPEEVAVKLVLNGEDFTSNDVLFEYQSTAARLATILLSVLGTIAGVSLIVAAIIFVIYKRKREKRVKLEEPDYSNLAFAGLLPDFSVSKTVEDPLHSLGELLLASDFSLVSSIVSSSQMSEMDQVSRALVFVFEVKNHSIDLLKYFITAEIQSAENEGSLFKASSVVSRMASVYSKLIGLPYLWRTLALAMHELNDWGKTEPTNNSDSTYNSSKYEVSMKGMQSIMAPTSMEVDPNKMGNTEDAAVNQLQLMLIAQKLFGTIIKSVDFMPTPLRLMYQHISEEVREKFPGQNTKVVAGFIFLRFICPAILAPHVYGLLQEPPNQECQRYLILLSKTLQNLAMGTLPGKKEDYMQKMNDFITENQEPLKVFVEGVVAVKADDSQPVAIPNSFYNNALAFLHNFILSKQVEYPSQHPNSKEKNEQLRVIQKDIGAPLVAQI